jgi:hypothetical protein
LYGFQLFFKFYVFDVTIYVWVIILNMAMRKQKLSPEASKAKAVRDKKIAMTPHRKKRKRENERMGQRSDSDIHHPSGGGPAVRVSIKNNRGNFGKGTKIEGPNMMGQTWLNRRIKGPNAEGDPIKKKNGKGVKPYQAIDMSDYNKRQQMYSDSLSANIATENIAKTIKSQSGGDWLNYSYPSKFNPNDKTPYRTSEEKGAETVTEAVGAFLGFSDDKPKSKPTSKNTNLYENYSSVKGIGSSINELKRTDKSLGISDKDSSYTNIPKKAETVTERVTEYFDDSIIWFELPDRPKPKQKILPPLATKKKSTITKPPVKKKERPVDKISKMPIGKLKSNYNTPEKLSYRKPETFVYYDKPKKTSLAVTGHPGSEKQYATVNRQDKKGTVVLNKDEYRQENKKTFLKIK